MDSTEPHPAHTYAANGTYNAALKVTDRTGRSASSCVRVLVGNAEPVVELTVTPSWSPFQFGQTVTSEVMVTDAPPVDCSEVTATV